MAEQVGPLGIDIGGVEDVSPYLTLVSGPRAAAEAVLCSWLHAGAKLWWAPERGGNLWQYLHGPADIEEVQLALATEAEKDERVEACSVTATLLGNELSISGALTLTQTAERVKLTLVVSAAGAVISSGVAG